MATSTGEFEQLILLAVMRLGDQAYGVEIRRLIEAETGREISAGAVYTALNRLEQRGFVRSRVGETAPERSGQRRRYYRVQPEGAAALHRTFRDVSRMAQPVLSALERLAQRARPSRG